MPILWQNLSQFGRLERVTNEHIEFKRGVGKGGRGHRIKEVVTLETERTAIIYVCKNNWLCHNIFLDIMLFHNILLNIKLLHYIFPNNSLFQDISLNIRLFHNISLNIRLFCNMFPNIKLFHDIFSSIMLFHNIFLNIKLFDIISSIYGDYILFFSALCFSMKFFSI